MIASEHLLEFCKVILIASGASAGRFTGFDTMRHLDMAMLLAVVLHMANQHNSADTHPRPAIQGLLEPLCYLYSICLVIIQAPRAKTLHLNPYAENPAAGTERPRRAPLHNPLARRRLRGLPRERLPRRHLTTALSKRSTPAVRSLRISKRRSMADSRGYPSTRIQDALHKRHYVGIAKANC